jgi:hypothetical protein
MKIAIIGSGISGLYTGFKLQEKYPCIDFDIYEQNKIIGGRIKTVSFDNTKVVAGAGIGRNKKDLLLKKFCKKIKIKTIPFQSKVFYTFKNYLNTTKINNFLLKETKSDKFNRSFETFQSFGIKILGKEKYNLFVKSVGGSDFEKADVIDTIKDYGFDDNLNGMEEFYINWNEFLKNLHELLKDKIFCNKKIKKIIFHENENCFYINKKKYDKIILATNIISIQNLLKPLVSKSVFNLYKSIKCQSFTRLYVKLNKPITNYSHVIITEKPFQRIIEMNREKCIYMISYSDNQIADHWLNIKNKKKYVESHIKKIFDENLIVKKIKFIYWKCGTHYFKPLQEEFYNDRDKFLDITQNPMNNIFCVGEAFSHNQGWCEGALQSVERIFSKIIK